MLRRMFFRFVFLGALTAALAAAAQPLVILVSIDGARWDYPELHDTPFLRELSAQSLRIQRLTPAYPTKTFPNHYTLVTGLRPESHGIVQNRFYDPAFGAWFGIGRDPAVHEGRWWGGEPIWVTAQRQGLRTAALFWPGSEAPIGGQLPDEWVPYVESMTEHDRVRQVLQWTARPAPDRPQFITLYFEAVDTAGHDFGPAAAETGSALRVIDTALAELRAGLQAQGRWAETDLIVTADHGMTASDPAHRVLFDDLIDPASVEVVFSGAVGGLNVKAGDPRDVVRALNRSPHLRAYRKADLPSRLHFSHNDRIPDIVIVPDLGWHLDTRAWAERPDATPSRGDHGYDPIEPDMGALFIGHGPGFVPGTRVPPTDNIHVYNLLCALLGIEPAPNEGDRRLAQLVTSARR